MLLEIFFENFPLRFIKICPGGVWTLNLKKYTCHKYGHLQYIFHAIANLATIHKGLFIPYVETYYIFCIIPSSWNVKWCLFMFFYPFLLQQFGNADNQMTL